MKFTIAIPAFKAQYLKECIDSVLSQTFSDYEIIIINDNSPENLDVIVSDFNDKRIRYFRNDKNFGAENVVENWNKCLSLAKGEYFVLMGDDDKMMPNYLEAFDILIKLHSYGNVFHCRSYIIDKNSKTIGFTPSCPEREFVYDAVWHRINGFRQQFISDFLFRTERLKSIGGFYKLPMAWASDDITVFETAGEMGIISTNDILFCYRRTQLTLSSSGSALLKFKAISIEENWYGKFIEKTCLNTNLEKCFLDCIRDNVARYFINKRINTLAYSGINNPFNILELFKWYKLSSVTGLTRNEFLYAIILSVKQRYAKLSN